MKRSLSQQQSGNKAAKYDVFVGKLASHVTKSMLVDIAKKDYELVNARIMYKNKNNQVGFRNGFITFRTKESAEKFIKDFNGKTGVFGSVHPISVRFGDGKANTKLFFGNLKSTTTEEQLQEMTGKYGKIMTSRLLSRSGKKVCGFVVFSTPKEAAACLEGLSTPNNDFIVEYSKSSPSNNNKRSSKRSRTSADSIWFHHRGSDMSTTSTCSSMSPFVQHQSPLCGAPMRPGPMQPGPMQPGLMQPMQPGLPMQQVNQLAQDEFGNWRYVNPSPVTEFCPPQQPLCPPSHFDKYNNQFIAQC
jgi:RNA recognition motif-containing protein